MQYIIKVNDNQETEFVKDDIFFKVVSNEQTYYKDEITMLTEMFRMVDEQSEIVTVDGSVSFKDFPLRSLVLRHIKFKG